MSVRAALLVGAVLTVAVPKVGAQRSTGYSRLIERLSEPGGSFHSDNLVSNETAYLHALDAFRAIPLKGGAYLGVGPEQNFSYLAELEPAIALLIDIRRDNLLLHLLFRSLFEQAKNRIEYLCWLYGRPVPEETEAWNDRPLEVLLKYIDRTPVDSGGSEKVHRRLMDRIARYGVPLSDADRAALDRFHREFGRAGLDLHYTTRAGPVWRQMPANRDLYLATDAHQQQGSYLATEARWRKVRELERRERVVPVVGNLAGSRAMPAIAAYLREIGQQVSVFYVSNVEQYLFRQGEFPDFAANVRALPFQPYGVIVRSVIGGPSWVMPTQPGTLASRQRIQPIARFLSLTAHPDSLEYWTLISDTTEARPE